MKSIFLSLACFVGCCVSTTQAQPGCTDTQATNFNASATINDGSCLYPTTQYTPVFVANLPNEVQEISGLTLGNAQWWGHNDSGYDEIFYHIDPEDGDLLQSVKVKNAHNKDWEDIASDSAQLYIGDFGNNDNDRQNLGIYTVPFSEIGNSNSETVQEFEWQFLPFSYIDQVDYSTQSEDSSVYDCEAMIVRNGKIHLFTKSRRNYNTVHYLVNTSSNVAEKVETFDTQGLITGASLSPDGKLIALVGYDLRPFVPTVFCWLLWDWQAGTDLFFTGNKRRIELGSALQVGQVESIGFDTERTAYITNEVTKYNGITIVGESVRKLDFSAWVPGGVGTNEAGQLNFKVYPNPFSNQVQLVYEEQVQPTQWLLKNQLGQTVLSLPEASSNQDLGFLPSGLYIFEAWKDGQLLGRTKGLKL